MSLMKMSSKELSDLVEIIADKFFEAKQMTLLEEQGKLLAEDNTPCRAYLIKVERAYATLEPKEQNLINNEFFFQNYHNWWVGLYTQASFYRFKKQTMQRFLEAFHNAQI